MENIAPTLPTPNSLNQSVSGDEWREFQSVCEAEINKGGERGAIAAKMLDISVRLRALSAEVDRALEKHAA